MMTDPRLAEMLCTKLCHDLTGPVGAIANGAEFLVDEDSGMGGQAIELISQSAEEAVHRLQFYRQAYGRVNHKGEASLSDAKLLIQDFFSAGKISLDWPDQYTEAANISISRRMMRLMYNLVLIASATLIRGGTVAIRLHQEESVKRVHISASGPTLKWEPDYNEVLAGHVPLDDVTPYTVQLYYTRQLSDQLGALLKAEVGDEMFELTVTQSGAELVG